MTWRLLIATQELALFDEEDRQMLDNADVLSWHCYTDLVQCNFANLREALRGLSLFTRNSFGVARLLAFQDDLSDLLYALGGGFVQHHQEDYPFPLWAT